jgi:hypothetical protein
MPRSFAFQPVSAAIAGADPCSPSAFISAAWWWSLNRPVSASMNSGIFAD